MAPTSRVKSHSEIVHYFNAINAKLLALALVISLFFYHSLLKISQGSNSCHLLLNKGYYHGDNVWQPVGCMMHNYTIQDTRECFSKKQLHVVFIGDSRIRQLYHSFISKLDNKYGDQQGKVHADLSYENSDLNFAVSFYWHGLTDTRLAERLQLLVTTKEDKLPQIVVAGTGSWDMKITNGSAEGLRSYRHNLTALSKVLDDWPSNETHLLWKLQDTVKHERLDDRRKMLSNDLVDRYNQVAQQVLSRSRFQMWHSAYQISQGQPNLMDGLHLTDAVLKHQNQVLFNMHCNQWMEFTDGTCCRTSEDATGLQLVVFVILFLCLVLALAGHAVLNLRHYRMRRHLSSSAADKEAGPKVDVAVQEVNAQTAASNEKTSTPDASSENQFDWLDLFTSLGKLGLIMGYFFLCDRTDVFMKENKFFTATSFWLPIGYVLVLGLFFHNKSRSTKLLHRDQTDEWKGWMQLVILIYHFTGASQVLPLYMHVRVLVSSYLFLTGYGHFCYFWNGGAASFVRFCQVMFRMNLMTVLMCLCMNRPYQSYYFVPLVTFWYTVVYVTLVLPPRVTAAGSAAKPITHLYLVGKIVALLACITVLYSSQVIFEALFETRPWKGLFVTSDGQAREWFFRWALDRYSICFGMIFAYLYVCAIKYNLIDDSTAGNLWRCAATNSVATAMALVAVVGYSVFTFTCTSKPQCNAVHSYIAFLPIVGFVVLRNAWGPLRTHYSSFFAWFGRISLELFIGQYHVWLAADTHGILVLVPDYPTLNATVTTYVLVCVAHEVHLVTGRLVNLVVPADWRLALRNVGLFFLVLVPIAVHDGML